MSDNLDLISQDVDTFIDPNGPPESILAFNHNAILKKVLNQVGKMTGIPFIAQKGPVVVDTSGGMFEWNGNNMNNTSLFTVTLSQLDADLMDVGPLLGTLEKGDYIRFKDYVGRTGIYIFDSYQAITTPDRYEITMQGVPGNQNYVYQTGELRICMLDFYKKGKTIDIEADDHHADLTALIADQNNQLEGEIHFVQDASDHPNIATGYAYFEYLGTTVGDETDYKIIATEESLINYLKVVTNDAYSGDRLAPIDTTLNGFEVRKDANESIGYRVRNVDAGNGAISAFVATRSNTLYENSMSMQMMGVNYFRGDVAGKGIVYSTEHLALVARNGNHLQFYLTPDFVTFTLWGEVTPNGVWFGVKETADTGTVIDLGYTIGDGNLCNMASANANTSFTLTNVRTGGKAEVLINASSEPTVTGATKITGSTFQASTNMYLKLKNNGNRTEYWFEAI